MDQPLGELDKPDFFKNMRIILDAWRISINIYRLV